MSLALVFYLQVFGRNPSIKTSKSVAKESKGFDQAMLENSIYQTVAEQSCRLDQTRVALLA